MPRNSALQRSKAGRPKGSVSGNTLRAQKMREHLQKKVEEEFGPIIQAQIDLATGVVIQQKVKLKNKTIDRYYTMKPDANAAKYILDQAIGRAKETLEVSGEMTLIDLVNKLERENV